MTFARLIGVKSVDGCLFHRQGNFPSYGFAELPVEQARMIVPEHVLAGVDFDTVRLLRHEPGVFVRGCGPHVEKMCKWRSKRQKEEPVWRQDSRGEPMLETDPPPKLSERLQNSDEFIEKTEMTDGEGT
jgi:hypothetical protein